MTPSSLHTLQLGMGWFPEQAGGLNRVYFNLTRSLPQVGVAVRGLVVGSPDIAAQTEGRIEGFAPASASLLTRWRRVRHRAREALAAQSYTLIAAHFALYAAPLGRQLSDTPFVMHFHGPWAKEGAREGEHRLVSQAKHRLERYVYRQAGLFIVLSEAFRDILHRSYGVPMERIRIVPGGVEVERFANGLPTPEARDHLGWPHDRPVILAVRRLRHRMGLENLITAMATVRKAVPEALLLLAGTGPLAASLKAQVDALGLRDHVRLLGFVPEADLPLAYRAATMTIVPTVALEGFGLITIESLAAGTPVLVTPVGGLPEAVRNLAPSLVLDGADAPALADGMARALRGTLALPDARACQSYVRTHHAWPVIARRVRAVYEEVV